jgi:hypothetical protein
MDTNRISDNSNIDDDFILSLCIVYRNKYRNVEWKRGCLVNNEIGNHLKGRCCSLI